jgi:hypothetical protein
VQSTGNSDRSEPTRAAIRIAFYAHFPFLEAILRPVHDALAGQATCLLTRDRRAVRELDPHVLVMAHHAHIEYFRFHLPRTVLVNVRHGMISKRTLRRLPRRSSARTFDFVCIGDENSLGNHARAGITPQAFWLTGYPQIDPLFRRDSPAALPFDHARPTVLYAPTWNLGLTSATLFGPRLVEHIRARVPGVNVLIKPHPMIPSWRPRWMRWWRRSAEQERGVHLVTDTRADVTSYMLAADFLISDASSAVFEFLALDRPIILLTNPLHRADPGYDPHSIIWRWRDVGEEVHDVGDVASAVERALGEPGRHRERRAHYAGQLFGPRIDGKNHERIAIQVYEAARRVSAGLHRSGEPGARSVGGVAWRWHDLRYSIGVRPWVRRAVVNHLEALRLRLRAKAIRPATNGESVEG